MFQVDGGTTSNALVMQMQADLIGINVVKAGFTESTALGAALVTYWGWQTDTQVTFIAITEGTVFEPSMHEEERDIRYKQWKMAVER